MQMAYEKRTVSYQEKVYFEVRTRAVARGWFVVQSPLRVVKIRRCSR